MLNNIIIWVTQLAWLSLFILVPGFILYLANEAWYSAIGRHSRKIELTTGIVGTPIHELSHAVMVKLFGMRIVEMALYKPDPQSNSLGYVNYSYQTGSLKHGIGRFFVGIAPLIGGGLAVYGLLWVTGLPVLHDYMYFIDAGALQAFTAWAKDLVMAIDRPAELIAVLLGIMISTHATPSKSDMAGSLSGVISVLLFYLAFRFLTALFPGIAAQYVYPYFNLESGALSLAALIIQMATLGALASALFALLAIGLGRLRSLSS